MKYEVVDKVERTMREEIMKNATMEKAINIQGLEDLTMISPWERHEDPYKV